MSEFLEVLSSEELQKLEKANKLLKEMSELSNGLKEVQAIKVLDNLYSLKADCDFAFSKFKEYTKDKCLPIHGKIETSHKFGFALPDYFYRLIVALEKGELVFVDKKD